MNNLPSVSLEISLLAYTLGELSPARKLDPGILRGLRAN